MSKTPTPSPESRIGDFNFNGWIQTKEKKKKMKSGHKIKIQFISRKHYKTDVVTMESVKTETSWVVIVTIWGIGLTVTSWE